MAAHFLTRFPVRCPRSGGTLQAPLCPPPRPVPRSRGTHQGKFTKETAAERKDLDKGNDKGKRDSSPNYSPSPADTMKGGVGRNSGGSSPTPNSPAAPSSSAYALRSSSRSRRSRSSHSDTSLPTSPSSPGGTSLPTSVVERKSSIYRRLYDMMYVRHGWRLQLIGGGSGCRRTR